MDTKQIELKKSQVLLVIFPFSNLDIPPLGIAILVSVIGSHGFFPGVLDLNAETFHNASEDDRPLWNGQNALELIDVYRFERLAEKIEPMIDYCCKRILKSSAPIVGFSLFSPNVRFSNEVAKRIKFMDPDRKILMGGPSCQLPGERRWIGSGVADAFVAGEAEEVMGQLLTLWPNLPSIPVTGVHFEKDRNHDVPIVPAVIRDLSDSPVERSIRWLGNDGNCYEQRRERVLRLVEALDTLDIPYPVDRCNLLDG